MSESDHSVLIKNALIQAVTKVGLRTPENYEALKKETRILFARNRSSDSSYNSEELNAVQLHITFLAAVMESACEYNKGNGSSIQSVIRPLLRVAEQGYLPAETLIRQMLDCNKGIFSCDQWGSTNSTPLALKSRITAISAARRQTIDERQPDEAGSQKSDILDEIEIRNKILSGSYDDNKIQLQITKLMICDAISNREAPEILNKLQTVSMTDDDLVKVTCDLFGLLDPVANLNSGVVNISSAGTQKRLIGKYYDGPLLNVRCRKGFRIVDRLLKMQFSHLQPEIDARVLLFYLQQALCFQTPSPVYLEKIFFSKACEAVKLPFCPTSYSLIKTSEAIPDRLGCMLYDVLLAIVKGLSATTIVWENLDVHVAANTVSEQERDHVEVWVDFINAAMQSAHRWRTSIKSPQYILEPLKAVALKGYLPAAEFIFYLFEYKDKVFSAEQLALVDDAEWSLDSFEETLRYRCTVERSDPNLVRTKIQPERQSSKNQCNGSKPLGQCPLLQENNKKIRKLSDSEDEEETDEAGQHLLGKCDGTDGVCSYNHPGSGVKASDRTADVVADERELFNEGFVLKELDKIISECHYCGSVSSLLGVSASAGANKSNSTKSYAYSILQQSGVGVIPDAFKISAYLEDYILDKAMYSTQYTDFSMQLMILYLLLGRPEWVVWDDEELSTSALIDLWKGRALAFPALNEAGTRQLIEVLSKVLAGILLVDRNDFQGNPQQIKELISVEQHCHEKNNLVWKLLQFLDIVVDDKIYQDDNPITPNDIEKMLELAQSGYIPAVLYAIKKINYGLERSYNEHLLRINSPEWVSVRLKIWRLLVNFNKRIKLLSPCRVDEFRILEDLYNLDHDIIFIVDHNTGKLVPHITVVNASSAGRKDQNILKKVMDFYGYSFACHPDNQDEFEGLAIADRTIDPALSLAATSNRSETLIKNKKISELVKQVRDQIKTDEGERLVEENFVEIKRLLKDRGNDFKELCFDLNAMLLEVSPSKTIDRAYVYLQQESVCLKVTEKPIFNAPLLGFGKHDRYRVAEHLIEMHEIILDRGYDSMVYWNYCMLVILFQEPQLERYRRIFFDKSNKREKIPDAYLDNVFWMLPSAVHPVKIQSLLIKTLHHAVNEMTVNKVRNSREAINKSLAEIKDAGLKFNSPVRHWADFINAIMLTTRKMHSGRNQRTLKSLLDPLIEVANSGYIPAFRFIMELTSSNLFDQSLIDAEQGGMSDINNALSPVAAMCLLYQMQCTTDFACSAEPFKALESSEGSYLKTYNDLLNNSLQRLSNAQYCGEFHLSQSRDQKGFPSSSGNCSLLQVSGGTSLDSRRLLNISAIDFERLSIENKCEYTTCIVKQCVIELLLDRPEAALIKNHELLDQETLLHLWKEDEIDYAKELTEVPDDLLQLLQKIVAGVFLLRCHDVISIDDVQRLIKSSDFSHCSTPKSLLIGFMEHVINLAKFEVSVSSVNDIMPLLDYGIKHNYCPALFYACRCWRLGYGDEGKLEFETALIFESKFNMALKVLAKCAPQIRRHEVLVLSWLRDNPEKQYSDCPCLKPVSADGNEPDMSEIHRQGYDFYERFINAPSKPAVESTFDDQKLSAVVSSDLCTELGEVYRAVRMNSTRPIVDLGLQRVYKLIINSGDLEYATARLFPLCGFPENRIQVGIKPLSVPGKEKGSVSCCWDGLLLTGEQQDDYDILTYLIKAHKKILIKDPDVATLYSYIVLNLFFRKPDADFYHECFFSKRWVKLLSDNNFSLCRPVFLQLVSVHNEVSLGDSLWDIVNLIVRGHRNGFKKIKDESVATVISELEGCSEPAFKGATVYMNFLGSFFDAGRRFHQFSNQHPQVILDPVLAATKEDRFIPGAVLLAGIMEQKEEFFSEEQRKGMGDAKKFRISVQNVIDQASSFKKKQPVKVAEYSATPVSSILKKWNGKNNQNKQLLLSKKKEIRAYIKKVILLDDQGQEDGSLLQNELKKILILFGNESLVTNDEEPDLKESRKIQVKEQVEWLAHGCHTLDDWFCYLKHYLGQCLAFGNVTKGTKALSHFMSNPERADFLKTRVTKHPELLPGIIMAAAFAGKDPAFKDCKSWLIQLIPSEQWNQGLVETSLKFFEYEQDPSQSVSAGINRVRSFLLQQAVLKDTFIAFNYSDTGKPAERLACQLVTDDRAYRGYTEWLQHSSSMVISGFVSSRLCKRVAGLNQEIKGRHHVSKLVACLSCNFEIDSLALAAGLISGILDEPDWQRLLRQAAAESVAVNAGLILTASQFSESCPDRADLILRQVVPAGFNSGLVNAGLKLHYLMAGWSVLPDTLRVAASYILGLTAEHATAIMEYFQTVPDYISEYRSWLNDCVLTRATLIKGDALERLMVVNQELQQFGQYNKSSFQSTDASGAVERRVIKASSRKQKKSQRQPQQHPYRSNIEDKSALAVGNVVHDIQQRSGLKAPEKESLSDKFKQCSSIECGICMHRYKESGSRTPKYLACHHYYCLGCLIKMVERRKIICPVRCNDVTKVPEDGVEGLRTNSDILEVIKLLQK